MSLSFIRAHLPENINSPAAFILIIILCFIVLVGLYGIFSKKITLPPLLKISLGLCVLGIYPVIDSLVVGYSGGNDALIARWLILAISLLFLMLYFIISYCKQQKKKGSKLEMKTDWTELDR